MPSGRLGGLITQHRNRANQANRRTALFLASLLFFTFFGFVYYLGLPLFERYLQIQGRSEFNEAQAKVAEAEQAMADLDARRDEAWERYVGSLRLKGDPDTGPGGFFIDLARDPRSGKIIATGTSRQEIGLIAESTNDGESWRVTEVDSMVNVFVVKAAVMEGGGTIFTALAAKDSESRYLFTLPENSRRWVASAMPDDADWSDIAVQGKTGGIMAVGGESVAFKRHTTDSRWRILDKGVPLHKIIPDPFSHGFVLAHRNGILEWVTPDGITRKKVDGGGVGIVDIATLPSGQGAIAVDRNGAVIQIGDGEASVLASENFGRIRSGMAVAQGLSLNKIEDGSVLMSDGNGMLKYLSPGTPDWKRRIVVSQSAAPTELLVLPTGAIIAAGADTLFRIDNTLWEARQALEIKPGIEGDQMIDETAIAPDLVMSIPEVNRSYSVLNKRLGERDRLVANLVSAQAERERVRLTGFEAAEEQEDLRAFMALCRGDLAVTEALTKTCVDAYVERLKAQAPTVWKIVSERAPPAVLLIFLLATLAGLYRYNMRMAGFHHSRADMLEVISTKGTGDIGKTMAELAEAMAADRVEFGRGKAPSDQAVELARTITNRG